MTVQASIAAASAVIAATAFVFSLWVRWKGERDAELRNWQRVVIYFLIEESKAARKRASFEDLKSEYLRSTAVAAMKLPRKEIQDDAFGGRVLLDLQRMG